MGPGFKPGEPPEPPTRKRVAFFGGSFDPPHLGHLAVAREAQKALCLDQVLFAPVGRQPLKVGEGEIRSRAGFEDRVAMTRIAIAAEPAFAVSLTDAPKPDGRPNYTIDALTQLHATLGGGVELFLLLGADAFRILPRWRLAAEVPFVANLIVVSRPGEEFLLRDDLAASLPNQLTLSGPRITDQEQPQGNALIQYEIADCQNRRAPLYLLPNLQYDVSATQLRQQIQGNLSTSIPQLLAPEVLAYIREHRLYL
jgi:nicotinate-nucleotide adenylyltransferase